jgi:hypothetical protein
MLSKISNVAHLILAQTQTFTCRCAIYPTQLAGGASAYKNPLSLTARKHQSKMYQLLWIVLQAASSTATLVNRSPELRVVTSSGIVSGIYNNAVQTVRGFIGIPYAEPPVGRLRFAPAQSKPPARHPIDASSFSDPCPQVYTSSNKSIWSILPYKTWRPANMSEDCLISTSR